MTIKMNGLISTAERKKMQNREVQKDLILLALAAVILFLFTQQVAWCIWGDEPILGGKHPNQQYSIIGDEMQPICAGNTSLCSKE